MALNIVAVPDAYAARRAAESGLHNDAIPRPRAAIESMRSTGNVANIDLAASCFVDTLIERRTDDDLNEAESLIENWLDPIYDQVPAARDVMSIRPEPCLAHARATWRPTANLRSYRDLAISLGFEGHRAWAEALPDL